MNESINLSIYRSTFIVPRSKLQNALLGIFARYSFDQAKTKDKEFTAYPSPADGQITISLSRPLTVGDNRFELYDLITGRVVTTASVLDQGHDVVMNIQSLPNGIYLLALRKNGQLGTPQKLLVQH